MPAIVEFPTVVKQALEEFGSHFANEPERQHFAEYITGLIIANKKNVSAINRESAVTTDQSCLNRRLTEVEWDEEDKIALQKKVKAIEKRRDEAWRNYDQAAREVEKKKDELIDTVEARLSQKIKEEVQFTICWSLV